MTRQLLVLLAVSLLLAVCDAARRRPEQLACASDLYARATTQIKNLGRMGRGQAPVQCPSAAMLASLP